MADKDIDKELAQLFVDLDRIHDRLQKASKKLRGDGRQDAVESALIGTSDACSSLTWVASGKLIRKLQKK